MNDYPGSNTLKGAIPVQHHLCSMLLEAGQVSIRALSIVDVGDVRLDDSLELDFVYR